MLSAASCWSHGFAAARSVVKPLTEKSLHCSPPLAAKQAGFHLTIESSMISEIRLVKGKATTLHTSAALAMREERRTMPLDVVRKVVQMKGL